MSKKRKRQDAYLRALQGTVVVFSGRTTALAQNGNGASLELDEAVIDRLYGVRLGRLLVAVPTVPDGILPGVHVRGIGTVGEVAGMPGIRDTQILKTERQNNE
jgi:hypothetical protein